MKTELATVRFDGRRRRPGFTVAMRAAMSRTSDVEFEALRERCLELNTALLLLRQEQDAAALQLQTVPGLADRIVHLCEQRSQAMKWFSQLGALRSQRTVEIENEKCQDALTPPLGQQRKSTGSHESFKGSVSRVQAKASGGRDRV